MDERGRERESQCFESMLGYDVMRAEIAGIDSEVAVVFHLSLSVFLPPTSAALTITSNNPLSAISKTFTPVMGLQ